MAAVLLWWGRGGAGLKLLWSDMWSLSIVFSRKVDCDVTCQLVWGRWLVSEKVKTRNWGYRCLVLSFKFRVLIQLLPNYLGRAKKRDLELV